TSSTVGGECVVRSLILVLSAARDPAISLRLSCHASNDTLTFIVRSFARDTRVATYGYPFSIVRNLKVQSAKISHEQHAGDLASTSIHISSANARPPRSRSTHHSSWT